MELREVMQKRRSIRQYLTTPVEKKSKSYDRGSNPAPTWKNAQEIRLLCGGFRRKKTGSTGCPG
ncbi:MAG: hypothetical protein ACLTTO_08540 [Lachnospiraceae bacterium]